MYHSAFDRQLEGLILSDTIQNLLDDARAPAIEDPYDFTDLHLSILNLSNKRPENAIKETPRSRINEKDATGRTALSWAAQEGDISSVEMLLRNGADPTLAGIEGSTPLHYSRGSCVAVLLNSGADIEAKNVYSSTPLYNAVRNNNIG